MDKLIELRKLSYQRSNGQFCVEQLDFCLVRGQKVAITGSNGSGKSTLLMMMLGLLQNVKGDVRLFGQPCRTEKDFARYRTRIGLLFQDSDDQLFCPTVIEDVCFGPVNQGHSQEKAQELAYQTLRKLGIEHLAHSVSHLLSGGQKRLVSLATILVMEPEVLLLDEPTNGLDEQNYQMLIDILITVDLPMVLVSHDKKLRQALTSIEYRLENGVLTF
ncbi:energy-coupling factor ABC transporter ATP-binding protein [Vibrio sp. HA2012]|uniref:energy-coupling factor ABC transporter ATP-binding protein n=1 Tax=Vibrio sp. HA2012 TaxID=1971595 RepID=UPI000C2B67AA|nr:ABC transporter ATP-binding protein [Vibrio sp. HA2012]PJC86662.1 energy-coupling factor ABC transporter ATP-binding protein [Vibrio sp. HA2012]